uniref:NADH-ubiquinone oxidoreductase chain 2 n=1 Tax=Sycophila sp. 2 JXW-2020 TaxID=2781670 RepID=A0A8A3UY05_9HYME|nr:NADH dehydrogenase subunit 2 [Sycophila sp. 2 JXW-2020]
MFLNIYVNLIFLPVLILSSVSIFFVSSWFYQWIIMEINMISFISLVLADKKSDSSLCIQYFLVQSIMSLIFVALSLNLDFLNFFNDFSIYFALNLILLIKMGLPPFFIWYNKFVMGLSWLNMFFLTTIQKIIPLFIFYDLSIYQFNNIYLFNLFCMLLFSFYCAMMGLFITNLKLLMSFSSIIQMVWIFFLMYLSEYYCLIMFFVYMIISLSMFLFFELFNCLNLLDLNMLILNNFWFKVLFISIFFSLSGLPPFFGFLLKWIAIYIFNYYLSFFFILFLIFNSLISMFFYSRIIFNFFFFHWISLKVNYLMINYHFNLNIILVGLIFLNFFGLSLFEIF